jgi:DNA-binding protein H-NS
MKDVIVYKKQAEQLVKAVAKAQEAVGEVYLVLAAMGLTQTATAETTPNVEAQDGAAKPAKNKKAKTEKKPKAEKKSATGNGRSTEGFAEI